MKLHKIGDRDFRLGTLRAIFVVVWKNKSLEMREFNKEAEAIIFWQDCKRMGWLLPDSKGPVLTWV